MIYVHFIILNKWRAFINQLSHLSVVYVVRCYYAAPPYAAINVCSGCSIQSFDRQQFITQSKNIPLRLALQQQQQRHTYSKHSAHTHTHTRTHYYYTDYIASDLHTLSMPMHTDESLTIVRVCIGAKYKMRSCGSPYIVKYIMCKRPFPECWLYLVVEATFFVVALFTHRRKSNNTSQTIWTELKIFMLPGMSGFRSEVNST